MFPRSGRVPKQSASIPTPARSARCIAARLRLTYGCMAPHGTSSSHKEPCILARTFSHSWSLQAGTGYHYRGTTFENDCLDSESRPSSNPRIIAPCLQTQRAGSRVSNPDQPADGVHRCAVSNATRRNRTTIIIPSHDITDHLIEPAQLNMPLQNHATSLRGMIHSSGMAHRCTPSSCDPFSRIAIVQFVSRTALAWLCG